MTLQQQLLAIPKIISRSLEFFLLCDLIISANFICTKVYQTCFMLVYFFAQ